jgi:phytoene dehydrogenase-like protein
MSTSEQQQRLRGPIPEVVDVAIIGSGLGALEAGAILARSGLRVACFEAHYTAGGCATQFSRGGKAARYHFDVGLHYIGDCGPGGGIPSLLREAGVEIDYEPMEQDGFDTLVFPGLRFRIPAGVELYRQRLRELFPGERRGIDRYCRIVEALLYFLRLDSGRRELPPLIRLPALARGVAELGRLQKATIGQLLDSLFRDPRIKGVLLGQSGDYGVPPSRASALLHLGLLAHYLRGAYYPRGGGQVIADELARVIERHGGTIHLRRPVERVLIEDGAARGVRLEGKAGDPPVEVRARCVLSNADLRLTLEQLVGLEHLPASWVERTRRFEMAAALFITFLGLKADLRSLGMRATNYWQFDSFDMEEFYRTGAPGEPITPRACYITSASLKDPRNALHHAPEGVGNVEVMTVVPGTAAHWGVPAEEVVSFRYKDNARYRELKAAVEENMIERLEALFPGSRRTIVFRESATPLSHTRFTRAFDGTGYGLAATPEQFLKGRPGYRGPLPQLYLCGASTRAGHGIAGALAGGRRAARTILKDMGEN